MFDLGLAEIVILAIIIIVLFFPHRTKDLVRNLGIAVGAVKEATKEVREEMKK